MKLAWWGRYLRLLPSVIVLLVLVMQGSIPFLASAATQTGTVSVTALVLPSPPLQPAVINSPANGSIFETTPLVVSGTCGANLLVRLYINNQLAGSIPCDPGGLFVMNVNLVLGTNILTAMNYDSYEQAGPPSASVTVEVIPPKAKTAISSGTLSQRSLDADVAEAKEALFHNTIIEPLAKVVGVGTVVSPKVNLVMAIIINTMFLLAVLGAVLVVLL